MTPFQTILYGKIVASLAKDHADRCVWWSSDFSRLPLQKLEAMAVQEAEIINSQGGFYLDEQHPGVHLSEDTLHKAIADALVLAYKTMGFTYSKSFRLIPQPPVMR